MPATSGSGTGNTKKTAYGTIHTAPMFVQYLEPAQRRFPLPVVLVHGGGGQMVHYMGLGGLSGWAHHFVQAGYMVYLVDRPGHGRSVYHPDALGEIGNLVTYDLLTRDTVTSARTPNKQWPGPTGDVGDPFVDQLVAAANSAPRDGQLAQTLWRQYGAELLDRIGPAVIDDALGGRSVRVARRQRAAEPGEGRRVVRGSDGAARRCRRRRCDTGSARAAART